MRPLIIPLDELSGEDLGHWRELARNALEPNPFFDPDYVLPANEALEGRGRGLAVVAGDDGWLACLPVHRPRTWHRLPLPGLAAWHHPYSFLGTPLVRGDDPAAPLAHLLEHLLARPRATFLGLDLIHRDGVVAVALRRAAATAGSRLVIHSEHERAALARQGDGGEGGVRIALSPKHRRNFERLRRRLEAELGTVLETVERSGEERAVETFLAMEAAGWKGRRGTAFSSLEHHAAFFRDVCRTLAKRGALELLSLESAGESVAMKCNIRAGRGSFCVKIAYDERWQRYSPGVQLELDNVERFRGDHEVEWMDSCAGPRNQMSNRLWGERRGIVNLAACAPRLRGRLAHGGVAASRRVPDRVRKP